MAEYAQCFAENRIDLSVLPHLTDQHLKELGVALGDRLKMLHAIGELTAASAAVPQSTAATKPAQQDTAERRQVTVMFSDLVGSTALSARMDPEDLREVISAYQKSVTETVQRFDGFVAKYMGDGVLVYFGYPQAHEDDAERAVRAGLELIAAVGAAEGLSSIANSRGHCHRAGRGSTALLGLDCPVVDEIAGIGLIRRCEPTYADADEAELGAVDFAFEQVARGGEDCAASCVASPSERARVRRRKSAVLSFN